MRDARHISSREVSHGVQRHVLTQTTWLGSTVMAHSGTAPLVFERLTTRFHPADHDPSGGAHLHRVRFGGVRMPTDEDGVAAAAVAALHATAADSGRPSGQFTRPAWVSQSFATVSASSLSLTSFFIISSRSSVVSLAETALSAALDLSSKASL